MANLGDISKIKLPNGNVVNIKDATVRAQALKIAKEDTGRNCFNNTATTATKNNITFTVNADKSVTLTATQAASADIYFELGYYTGDGTTRKLMGAPSGSSTSKWWLFGGNGVDDVGSGVNITNSSIIYIIVKSGQTPNNITFKPMITTQAWIDAGFTDFQPYALPNTKITPELIELVDSGAKNILELDLATIKSLNNSGRYTWNNNAVTNAGVTYTINSDMSITLTGTASGLSYIRLKSNFTVPKGTLILSGCPSGGATNTYRLYTDGLPNGWEDVGQSVERIFTSDVTVTYITIAVNSGTATGFTFKPMICTKAAWDVSQKYVPYGMSNPELTNNISNVQTSLAVSSSDNGKVLTASYSGGTGSYAWVTPSGGGSASVVEGYISSNHNKFYSDSAKTIEIAGEANKLYVDRTHATTDGYSLYKWAYNDDNSSFVRAGSEVVKGEGTYGVVKNGSSVTSATGYTASPIIGGVPYYKDTTYSLVGTKDSTGLIKNGSTVTSSSGYTASPIINGIPYYKNTTYNNATTSTAGLMSSTDKTELNKTPKVLVRSSTRITASTSLSDTGVSYTISANKYVRITASAKYSTSNPVEIKIGTGSSDFAHVVAQSGDNVSLLTAVAYVGGYSSSTTAKVYAKFSSSGTNFILLCVEEIPSV